MKLGEVVVHLEYYNFTKGTSINHVDDPGGEGFSKYPHKYITLI